MPIASVAIATNAAHYAQPPPTSLTYMAPPPVQSHDVDVEFNNSSNNDGQCRLFVCGGVDVRS
jgi:hypothetical protein